MVSFIYGSGEPNLYFHEIVSPKLNVTDLVTELREFELLTDGLKADLQARLQLAYLGVLAPEHEEEIAGWFGLNKAGLDKKCKELGVVSGPAKASMQVNRRAAVMKFLGINAAGVSTTPSIALPASASAPAPAPAPAPATATASSSSPTIAVTQLANALANTPLTVASATVPSAAAPWAAELARSFGPPSTLTSILPPAPVSTTPAPLVTPAAVVAPEPTASTTVSIPAALMQEIRRLADIEQVPAVNVLAPTPSFSFNESPSATLDSAPAPGPSSAPAAPAPATAPALAPGNSPSPPLLPSASPLSPTQSPSTTPIIPQVDNINPPTIKDEDVSPTSTSSPSCSSGIICILSDTLYQAQGPVMSRLGDSDQTYLDALTHHFHDKFMARLVTVGKRY